MRGQIKPACNTAGTSFTFENHEYCDLRELEDTILSKNLRESFENRSANEETLSAKFRQLQGSETACATVDRSTKVTRKEDEAAILWFEQILVRT